MLHKRIRISCPVIISNQKALDKNIAYATLMRGPGHLQVTALDQEKTCMPPDVYALGGLYFIQLPALITCSTNVLVYPISLLYHVSFAAKFMSILYHFWRKNSARSPVEGPMRKSGAQQASEVCTIFLSRSCYPLWYSNS